MTEPRDREGGHFFRFNENPTIDDCMFHRCIEHRAVAQINENEFTGAECGACIQAYYQSILSITVARLGGQVEGTPTSRINFLQRIDELRHVEEAAIDEGIWGRERKP